MSVERVFLGWDRPCLAAAVDFLLAKYRRGSRWDMGAVVIATPGARAGRRLLELLADRAARPDFESRPLVMTPPNIVTVGSLPEELYEANGRVADNLHSLLARIHALRTADPSVLARIVSRPPGRDDLPGWAALARDLEALSAEIAGEALEFSHITAVCRAQEGGAYADYERWTALRTLQDGYAATLARAGLVALYDARRIAVEHGMYKQGLRIVLVATVDLPHATRIMLRKCAAEVVGLVHAPAEHADGFDELGCLNVDYWTDRQIPIPASAIKIVTRPMDQAAAMVDAVESLPAALSVDEITVGMGDDNLGPLLQRTLELSGRPARRATSRPARLSRPAMLLASLADYWDSGRADDFAALIRHPEITDWLSRELAHGLDPAPWLRLLDRHIPDYLPWRLDTYWPDQARHVNELRAAEAAVRGLMSTLPNGKRALPDWSGPIAALLAALYGRDTLDPNIPDHARLMHGLSALSDCLRAQRGVDPSGPLAAPFTASEAIRFTLARLSDQELPPEGGEAAIEILGWLELPLDDAPALIITSMNEGNIPESVNADAFLPDRLRRKLRLMDNRRRYARDAYLLRAILESRPHVTLIAGRVSASHDPLMPSRLLFACDDDQLVARALDFTSSDSAREPSSSRLELPHGNSKAVAAVARPRKLAAPLTRLRVTAFRDYLACPYRFYLRHILRLESLDDSALEMDSGRFGTLLHDVLNAFGRSPIKDSEDEDVISEFLLGAVDKLARSRFGTDGGPAVEIQIRQMGRRLREFAKFQAGHAASGWRIEHVEKTVERQIEVAGQPFVIYGRLDRIDRHKDSGECLILDYKSNDSRKSPEQTHRTTQDGAKVWIDLQLPLYRRLAPALGIDSESVKLGIIALPKDLDEIACYEAKWSPEDLAEADGIADRVIAGILAENFWPPNGTVPMYPDGLGRICLDSCIDREVLLREVAAVEMRWSTEVV